MKQPTEPSQEDCCNSGCNPCIFDIYVKQLKIYKQFLECRDNFNEEVTEDNAISQLEYTSFVVVSNINLCESHNLLTFKKVSKDCKKLKWKPGQHFLLKFNSQENVCTRAYTPISKKTISDCDFAIIIKRYENGLVSKYLCSLNQGDKTLWRGPYGNYEITANKYSRILMLAQGTGIVPFVSIIEKILHNEDDMTKIVLFYCCQNHDTILFREELYNFKSYWNFSYEVYISNVSEDIKCRYYQEPLKKHKFNYEVLDQYELMPQKDQFLLCGSQQFMKHYELWLLEKNITPAQIMLF